MRIKGERIEAVCSNAHLWPFPFQYLVTINTCPLFWNSPSSGYAAGGFVMEMPPADFLIFMELAHVIFFPLLLSVMRNQTMIFPKNLPTLMVQVSRVRKPEIIWNIVYSYKRWFFYFIFSKQILDFTFLEIFSITMLYSHCHYYLCFLKLIL